MRLGTVLPLLIAVALCVPIVLARVHRGTDRLLTRVSIHLVGNYVNAFQNEHPNRVAALRGAHMATTYRAYGSKTMLYAVVFGIVGSVVGLYAVWGLLSVLAIDPDTLRDQLPAALSFVANFGGVPALSPLELFTLLVLSCLTFGVVSSASTYWLRWWYPSYVADNRAREIETALPATVSFIYALSRSGMEFPKILRIVAENEATYGEAAAEFEVAIRNVDTFGMDVITALETMGRRSPSPQFQEFTANLVSVLQSGHSLSSFLERQYHDYREEAESQQERMLDLLGTLAESYVTVLVAGPLFLITILFVIGISVGETFEPLRALIYIILPFANLAFIVYLSVVTDSITVGQSTPAAFERSSPASPSASTAHTDGGTVAEETVASKNIERIRFYRYVRRIRTRLDSPWQTLLERPNLIFVVTVPPALLLIGSQLPRAIGPDGFDITVIDDLLVLTGLFVGATFTVVYELHRRRIDAVEAAIPDLLDRLASVNEAGMSLITGIGRVRDSDLGALDVELDRIWNDIEWGADLDTALRNFGGRVRTRSTSRVVTLLTEAMNASGNLSTVLRIAARQAAADRRLKRERAQTMLEYMVVVYISFLVFLFIIAILTGYMLPTLQAGGPEATAVDDAVTDTGAIDGLGGLDDVDIDAYTTLFYHATLIQGTLSGLIAGQLSTGDVRAGAKHAVIMVTLTFFLFLFII